ncbi:unnamed protein product, partial [Sphenostylis stenocarpa]
IMGPKFDYKKNHVKICDGPNVRVVVEGGDRAPKRLNLYHKLDIKEFLALRIGQCNDIPDTKLRTKLEADGILVEQ